MSLIKLTQEQEIIRSNWEGAVFKSFDDQFQALTSKRFSTFWLFLYSRVDLTNFNWRIGE